MYLKSLTPSLIQILEEGSGDCPVSGNEVEVHYTGRLLDGKVFDSSKTRGEFFKFKVGTGQLDYTSRFL